jgi:hypothetical protein
MQEIALFPFIDPAVQIIVVAAAALVMLFFLSSVSDVLRARQRRPRRMANADSGVAVRVHASPIEDSRAAS